MNLKLGTIEEEASACRAAWAAVGNKGLARCVHHEVHFEYCHDAEGRIHCFLTEKAKQEQETALQIRRRLREFRPLTDFPEEVARAAAEVDRARAEFDRTRAEFDRIVDEVDRAAAEVDRAVDEYYRAQTEYDCAEANLDRTIEKHLQELETLDRAANPWTAWNGKAIFSHVKD